MLINFLSYNGGTWNLAQRFIAAPTAAAARKAALLSAALYLIWPLVLFFPMWASPLLLPAPRRPIAVLCSPYADFCFRKASSDWSWQACSPTPWP